MTRDTITAAERQMLKQAGLDDILSAFDASAKRATAQVGKLEQIVHVDEFSGRKTYEFVGDKRVWMSVFQPKEAHQLVRFVVPSKHYGPTLINPAGGLVEDHRSATTTTAGSSKPGLLARLFGNN